MKKFFLFALVAAFAFTSCTKDETIATTQPGAIAFAPAVDNATRSTVDPSFATEKLPNDFNVYGFMNDMTGLVFDKAGETVSNVNGVWTYKNTQYWTRNNYYFAALAPVTGAAWTLTPATTDVDAKLGVGTVHFNNDGTQDLLYWAGKFDNKQGAYEQNPVHIAFNHLLSKVKFSFVNDFDNSNVSLVVRDITITNAGTKGNINLAVENWWDGNDDWKITTTGSFKFGNAAVGAENAQDHILQYQEIESYREMLLFPVNAKKFNVTFNVDIYMGQLLATTIPHTVDVETTLEMGKAYDFKAILSGESEKLNPITFTVDVIDWVDAGEVNGVIPSEVITTEAEFTAAIANGGYFKLGNDIEISSTLEITKNFVLDLNGKTLKNKVENTNTDVLVVKEGAKLTIDGVGTIEAVSGNDGYAIISEGELAIYGGTIKSGVDVNNEPNAVIYARGNGKVFVNGGEFPNDNTSKFVLNKKDADRATTVIEVRGGKFWNFNPADNAAENPGTNFVAEGYKSQLVENETNVWEVVKQ